MYVHKYRTKVGPAFLIYEKQSKPSGNIMLRVQDWQGRGHGPKADTAFKFLEALPTITEEEVEEKKVEEKKAVLTLANKVREFASFLTPEE